MADRLDFLNGVTKLHGFYTEQVRMLAHAYDLKLEDAAMLLDQYGYHTGARAILVEPQSDEPESKDLHEAEGRKS